MSLGQNIKRLRQGKGWTQGKLASESGVKLGHISKLERDENSDPKLSTLRKLMNALECTPNALMENDAELGITGQLETAFEVAEKLPEEDKNIIIRTIAKFHRAAGLDELEENRYILGVPRPFGKKAKAG